MSQEPQQIEKGSRCPRLRVPPEHRFLTNPGSDPLGLAEEIYYGRTGLLDYQEVLARQEDPSHAKGPLYKTDAHPFLHCFTEQNRYNKVVDAAGKLTGDLQLYRGCRYRWYNKRKPKSDTRPCGRPFCPACWMLKIERAYGVLADTVAPVIGVQHTYGLQLDPLRRQTLTPEALRSLISPSRLAWSPRRHQGWHVLFWALFPCPGSGMPLYKIVAIHVARDPVPVAEPAWVQAPGDPVYFGVPRVLETSTGDPSTAFEHTFTGEHRLQEAWQAFRRATPAPIITTSLDGTSPTQVDLDQVIWDHDALRWPRLTRVVPGNQVIFADGAPPDLGITEPRLDPGSYGEAYGDLRDLREHDVEMTKLYRRAEADAKPKGSG